MSNYNTYRLNRFFNVISNPMVHIALLLINAVLILSKFLFKFGIIETIFYILIINSILILDRFFHSTKEFTSNGEMIEFIQYVALSPKTSRFAMTKGRFIWRKVSYSVSSIHDIVFHQNFIEKFFNIGHISFKGKALFTAKKDLDRITEKNMFTLYGIRNFSEFKLKFHN